MAWLSGNGPFVSANHIKGHFMSTLIVNDIHKKYGGHHVLKGVSLSAKTGDVISVIGSSGSGKSTFLRCINFLELPCSGSITLNDDTVQAVPNASGELRVDSPGRLLNIWNRK